MAFGNGNGNGKLVGGGFGICFDARHTSLVHRASAPATSFSPLSPFLSCIPSFILGEWVGFWEGIAGGVGDEGWEVWGRRERSRGGKFSF